MASREGMGVHGVTCYVLEDQQAEISAENQNQITPSGLTVCDPLLIARLVSKRFYDLCKQYYLLETKYSDI